MRHVVLGSSTPLGSAVVRMLISFGIDPIVAVSPSGEIPPGVNPNNVQVEFGDIVDAYSLLDIFQENDIIYNTQVLFNETSLSEDAELYHNIGVINLLGIATAEKANKIVCVLPLTTGWSIPINADENVTQRNSTEYHKTIKLGIEILRKYWEQKNYGWQTSRIMKLIDDASIEEANENENGKEKLDSKTSGPSLNKVSPQTPKVTSGPKMPNLGKNDTTKSNEEPNKQMNKTTKNLEEKESNENNIEAKIEKMDEISKQKTIQEFNRIPVVLARIARQFGPYEQNITEEFCRATRLQRLSVVGKLNKPISWINPLDAARAMIILGDPQSGVKKGQYNICGFTATPMEIIRSLEKINHSTTKIERKSLFIERIKHWYKRIREKFGDQRDNQFYYYLALNKAQVFDDSKAREAWNWEEKYGLEATAKESMKWFIHHVL